MSFETKHHQELETPPHAASDFHMDDGRQKAGFYFLWIAMFLFLLMWGWGALKSLRFMRQSSTEQTSTEEDDHVLTKKERKERLVTYFNSGKNKLILSVEQVLEDLTLDKNATNAGSGDDEYDIESTERRLRICTPGDEREILFSRQCAICLEPYKGGDSIVWSSSSNCSHVFHEDCLVDGLTRVTTDEMPCPCCRAQFCKFSEEDSKDAKEAAQ